MKKAQLAVLLGFLQSQKQITAKILEDIGLIEPDSSERKSHLGYLLHNLYCTLEDLWQEVARTFENRLEDPARYHRELLQRMHLEIPGIRPRVLNTASYQLLNELRGFRHIFRHAYDYELDEGRLRQLKARLALGWTAVAEDLENFRRFLQEGLEDK
jgi:HepT-like protein